MENKLCEYGCGQIAQHVLKNGRLCCEKSWNKCPEIRKRNSDGLKKAYKEGRKKSRILEFRPDVNWNKGQTILRYDEVFVKDCYRKTDVLKKIILRDNLKKYKCEKCENKGVWMNEEVVLELDHINGDNKDNRLENLRFLCPNCHSQTPTFRGRNSGVGKKVSDKEMIEAIKKSYTMSEALRRCGLVEKGGNFNRIRRVMNRYSVGLLKKQKKLSSKKRQVKKCLCPECGKEIRNRSIICNECRGKSQRKTKRPPYKQLLKEIKETSYVAVGRKYGVSDNAIRKWIKTYEKEF